MVSLNWSTAWGVWKLVLIGAGGLVLVGILSQFMTLFSIIVVIAVVGVTVFLYRKGSSTD